MGKESDAGKTKTLRLIMLGDFLLYLLCNGGKSFVWISKYFISNDFTYIDRECQYNG